MDNKIKIGLFGFGVVGQGILQSIAECQERTRRDQQDMRALAQQTSLGRGTGRAVHHIGRRGAR